MTKQVKEFLESAEKSAKKSNISSTMYAWEFEPGCFEIACNYERINTIFVYINGQWYLQLMYGDIYDPEAITIRGKRSLCISHNDAIANAMLLYSA